MKKTKSGGTVTTKKERGQSDVKVKGNSVTLTGELGNEVRDWLAHSYHKPDDLREIVGAFCGMPPRNLRKVEIELPENLLEWVTREAEQGQGETVGEFISHLLESERFRWSRMFYSWKGGAK